MRCPRPSAGSSCSTSAGSSGRPRRELAGAPRARRGRGGRLCRGARPRGRAPRLGGVPREPALLARRRPGRGDRVGLALPHQRPLGWSTPLPAGRGVRGLRPRGLRPLLAAPRGADDALSVGPPPDPRQGGVAQRAVSVRPRRPRPRSHDRAHALVRPPLAAGRSHGLGRRWHDARRAAAGDPPARPGARARVRGRVLAPRLRPRHVALAALVQHALRRLLLRRGLLERARHDGARRRLRPGAATGRAPRLGQARLRLLHLLGVPPVVPVSSNLVRRPARGDVLRGAARTPPPLGRARPRVARPIRRPHGATRQAEPDHPRDGVRARPRGHVDRAVRARRPLAVPALDPLRLGRGARHRGLRRGVRAVRAAGHAARPGSGRRRRHDVIRAAALLLGLAARSAAAPPMTTLAPRSDFAHWTQVLYLQVIGWDAFILVLVAALLALGIFRYSTRAGAVAGPPPAAHQRVGLEVAWTVGPALVLLAIAVPTIRVTFRAEPASAPPRALEVDVTAHQWWWEVAYPALGVHTANEIHLPVARPVRFVLRSADVIHSFWVPALGGKRDVVPGHPNVLTLVPDTPGTYLGQCAEFCGLSHANMRLRVMVETPEGFAAWAAHQALPAAVSAAPAALAGARVFAASPCVTCHTVKGLAAGNRGPDLTHLMTRTTIAGGTLANTPDLLAAWLLDPQALKPGAQMPALGLGREQVTSLVTYLESLD